MRFPVFNKDQREGLAKVADNVATASVVAALLGGFVDKKVTSTRDGVCNPVVNVLCYRYSKSFALGMYCRLVQAS